ncbi:alpha,alpha-phosphotrehalase [uncultured Subdoligranulum sp.]|uniref:alpha,alpha-phosphotrehalase n=1 Tax=uncultured Subdoligranulum sp. TaxID=512298 RepID=UPI0025FBCD67|nr:alpha,alpha-phosphotrehalase [uncultured Subdoligranulum sp.]
MKDFRECTVYEIYPKSFLDTNGDGLGELRGVTRKLDYLKELGVDYLWLTPFFVSPQNDNGYDVADYRRIDPRYGTMEDFEELSREAARRGIGLMLDMVFNHTSTDHEWFRKALAGDPKYKAYYIFKKGKPDGTPPTNWESKFGGSAWEYLPQFDEYYLHLFDKTQADLNWDNPEVRQEVADVVRFWMDKGVRGFRFDVINLISKGAFEDDDRGDGRRFYTDGPRIHEYLQELNQRTFGRDPGIITVGEMSSTTMENCFRYAGADGRELSMVFSFHHLKVDFMGNEKWVLVPTDFAKLKEILFSWQSGMAAHDAWNAVFWCNHDQPRVVSRFGDEGTYWKQSAKMLADVIHCLRGTPYIYQGEEIGMTNAGFTDLSQYRDVESLNHFQILRDKGMSEESAYNILKVHSRDNSRTPMQWTDGENAGFTAGTPWISVNPNCRHINAESQVGDPDSIFSHYRALIRLRKEYAVISRGDFAPLDQADPAVLAYRRRWKGDTLYCINNFYPKPCRWTCPEPLDGCTLLLANYPDARPGQTLELRPYESLVLLRREES